jgi:hypothetical protein
MVDQLMVKIRGKQCEGLARIKSKISFEIMKAVKGAILKRATTASRHATMHQVSTHLIIKRLLNPGRRFSACNKLEQGRRRVSLSAQFPIKGALEASKLVVSIQ